MAETAMLPVSPAFQQTLHGAKTPGTSARKRRDSISASPLVDATNSPAYSPLSPTAEGATPAPAPCPGGRRAAQHSRTHRRPPNAGVLTARKHKALSPVTQEGGPAETTTPPSAAPAKTTTPPSAAPATTTPPPSEAAATPMEWRIKAKSPSANNSKPKSALKPPTAFHSVSPSTSAVERAAAEIETPYSPGHNPYTPRPVRRFVQRVEDLLKNRAEESVPQPMPPTPLPNGASPELVALAAWCVQHATWRNALHFSFLVLAMYSCFHVDIGGASKTPRVSRSCTAASTWTWGAAPTTCGSTVLGWVPVGTTAPYGFLTGMLRFVVSQLGFDGTILLFATLGFWAYRAVVAKTPAAKAEARPSSQTVVPEAPAVAEQPQPLQP